jgi:hypothetical protein
MIKNWFIWPQPRKYKCFGSKNQMKFKVYKVSEHYAGRLKSPSINGFSWSKSIEGDFNRPA